MRGTKKAQWSRRVNRKSKIMTTSMEIATLFTVKYAEALKSSDNVLYPRQKVSTGSLDAIQVCNVFPYVRAV